MVSVSLAGFNEVEVLSAYEYRKNMTI